MKHAIAIAALAFAPAAGARPAPHDAAPRLDFALEEIVTLGPVTPAGTTAHGGRTIIPITGGSVAGPRIKGVVLPGGWDWQLLRSDGCTELKADYMLRLPARRRRPASAHDGGVRSADGQAGLACQIRVPRHARAVSGRGRGGRENTVLPRPLIRRSGGVKLVETVRG